VFLDQDYSAAAIATRFSNYSNGVEVSQSTHTHTPLLLLVPVCCSCCAISLLFANQRKPSGDVQQYGVTSKGEAARRHVAPVRPWLQYHVHTYTKLRTHSPFRPLLYILSLSSRKQQ